ncbi:F-box only protein 27-like isoform X2 [Podarcis muralis]
MGLVKSKSTSTDGMEIQCLVDLNPLPEELLELILSWVPARTLVTRCRLVCCRWRDLIDRPTVWKLQWERDPRMHDAIEAAQRCPRMDCSRVGVLRPFGRNLIKNPCGTEQFQHWVIQHGGNGWRVEENRHHVEGAEAQTCFASSYVWGAREDCGCRYKIRVELLAADWSVIAEFNANPDPIPQWNDAQYQKVSHVFRSYGPGVRYIQLWHKGVDTQFWEGHYGARITNSTVLVKLSPEPLRSPTRVFFSLPPKHIPPRSRSSRWRKILK